MLPSVFRSVGVSGRGGGSKRETVGTEFGEAFWVLAWSQCVSRLRTKPAVSIRRDLHGQNQTTQRLNPLRSGLNQPVREDGGLGVYILLWNQRSCCSSMDWRIPFIVESLICTIASHYGLFLCDILHVLFYYSANGRDLGFTLILCSNKNGN